MSVFLPRPLLPLGGWQLSFASAFWAVLRPLNAVWEDVRCKWGSCCRLVSHTQHRNRKVLVPTGNETVCAKMRLWLGFCILILSEMCVFLSWEPEKNIETGSVRPLKIKGKSPYLHRAGVYGRFTFSLWVASNSSFLLHSTTCKPLVKLLIEA